jgi:hypothetical protein
VTCPPVLYFPGTSGTLRAALSLVCTVLRRTGPKMYLPQNTCQGKVSLHLPTTNPNHQKHDLLFFSGWDPKRRPQ